VVAKVFRAGMAQALRPDAILEHHPTLTSAMENFCQGDIIHIHEGIYSGASLHGTANGTIIKAGESVQTLSPPKKRPIQVSESHEIPPIENGDITEAIDDPSNDVGDRIEPVGQASPDFEAVPKVELQIAFNSCFRVDVDPETPVAVTGVLLHALLRPVESKSDSQRTSISPKRGGNVDEPDTELVRVCRGTLSLKDVTLDAANTGVGLSVAEGATLKMQDCIVKGPQLAAILAHPRAILDLKNVTYVNCVEGVKTSAMLGEVSAVEAAKGPSDCNGNAETDEVN